jgi:hypothetical protein
LTQKFARYLARLTLLELGRASLRPTLADHQANTGCSALAGCVVSLNAVNAVAVTHAPFQRKEPDNVRPPKDLSY